MKLSYNWLLEYVDIHDVTPDALAEKLTAAGLAVDAVEWRGQGVTGVVVGHVVTCDPHPNADRLKVCQVDVGQEDLLTIVCGAPNVCAGQKVPVAVVGAQLPGITIGRAKLRGVESSGMLCSAKELGLEVRLLPKEQTDGLYLLPEDSIIGADAAALLKLNDAVLEIDLTPNRSDCLSMRGLATEVAALFGRQLRFDAPAELAASGQAPVSVCIDSERCSRYEAWAIEGVTDAPSPLWMQMRLMAMGIRPISLIVDITNYVMLEWGQPLHAFDWGEIHGGTIVVRHGRNGERLVTLDGEERELTEDTIVIADEERAIGIAGVMGGENSEIKGKTQRIVLESAAFDARSVRRTGQRLGLRSEAQQRFEKGIDGAAIHPALIRAGSLMMSLGGAKAVGPVVAAGLAAEPMEMTIAFSHERCNRLLGTAIAAEEMHDIFERLGFGVDGVGDLEWNVTVPSRRMDISLEADLIEEIGRMYGLDAIPTTLPWGPTTAGVRTASQHLRQQTREILFGTGMTEVFTYTFASPADLDPLRLPADSAYLRMIPLMRPMSEERTGLRTHLLPGLASVAKYNLARGVAGGSIFEVGRVFWPKTLPLTEQPVEKTFWAGLWFGETDAGLGEKARKYDFYDAKGIVETWLTALGLEGVEYIQSDATWYHPGRCADVIRDGVVLGSLGELHPDTTRVMDVSAAVYAEFDLDVIGPLVSDSWRVRSLPRYQAASRDLAVLVRREVTAGQLVRAAMDAAKSSNNILESCRVFDVYTGIGVPEGHKSVAIAFVYRAEDRTLTDEEISGLEASIVKVWEEQFEARLRS